MPNNREPHVTWAGVIVRLSDGTIVVALGYVARGEPINWDEVYRE